MNTLYEIKYKTMNVAFLEISDSYAKKRKYIRGSPSVKCEMESVLDRSEVVRNDGARSLIHIRYVARYSLMGVDLDGGVEHGEDFAELFILDNRVRSCTA